MDNLKKIRLKHGLTQDQLCKELEKLDCCINRSTYTKYEKNTRKIHLEVLIKLALFFDTSTDYLLDFSDDCSPHSRSSKYENY